MANSKLKFRAPFISAVSLAMGASAQTITAGGGTIPANAGNIWFFVPAGDNVHWHPTGTPTSSFGHAVGASNWGYLKHSEQGAKIISDDGANVTLLIIYERGSGRQDAAYAISEPI
jgi:hypothetical protein